MAKSKPKPGPEPEPEKLPKSALAKRRAFVVQMARGRRINAAARLAGIGERTAYRWNKDPAIREQIAEIHRANLGRAMGRLAAGAELAAAEMVKLITSTAPAATINARLAACRAVLADLISVRAHVELSEQVAEMVRRLD